MPSDADARALGKTFEPILLFHPDEQFFPIDPKWYLERCALWRAAPAFDDKTNWGEPPPAVFPRVPQLPRDKIAALKSETAGGRTWIGAAGQDFGVGTAPLGEAPPPTEEHFLEFVGWEPVVPPPNEVTPSSQNRHPALNPADYTGPLAQSRPWYYVEFLTNADLQRYTGARKPNGLDLAGLVANNARLNKPRALLYHLFYPMHQEALEGCEGTPEGPSFATYAGEWACVAVLVDSGNQPLFIGLTSRNVGDPNLVGSDELRVGMTVSKFSDAQTVGMHPKIFVSRGTHGNYLTGGPHAVTPFTGGIDLSTGSCGTVEGLDDVIAGDVTIPGEPSDLTPVWVIVVKFFIFVIGWVWLGIEASNDHFGTDDTLVGPTATPQDQTAVSTFGKIIRPDGLAFAETAQAASVIDWSVAPFQAPAPDQRKYDFVITRPTQLWWAPRHQVRDSSPVEGPGWFGRWGPRVTNDPHVRRAGMRCPDFLLLLLEGVAVAMNK